jgi:hypothetical protein
MQIFLKCADVSLCKSWTPNYDKFSLFSYLKTWRNAGGRPETTIFGRLLAAQSPDLDYFGRYGRVRLVFCAKKNCRAKKSVPFSACTSSPATTSRLPVGDDGWVAEK